MRRCSAGGIGGRRLSRRAIATFASLALTALMASTASASGSEELAMTDLLDWIAATTEHEVDRVRRALPAIVFATPGEELRFGDESLRIAPEMGGIWDTEHRLIVLVEPWHAADPVDLSILLHELVHAVQSGEGGSVCDPEAEWEAYELQARWLAERGIVMLIDWNEVWEHSLCPDDAAP